MATYNPDEPLGPDSFGGDEYAPDEPTPEQVDRAEAELTRIERAYAVAREKASLAELVNEARSVLAAFPCVESVTLVCEPYEYDDERGSAVVTSQEKVHVTIAPGAVLDPSQIDALAKVADALQSAAQNYAVAAGLLDRTLTVTRDGAVVK